jgi:formimidoylglutamate deiminase
MLKAGYTAVCEFHYLHHRPDGRPYDDPLAASHALLDAAATSGIGMTLLPTLYQTADFGGAPPTPRQRQFVLETDRYLDLLDACAAGMTHTPQVQLGIAFHSLRAVPAAAMNEVLAARPHVPVIHIHVAEQEREVASAVQHLSARPVAWLLDRGVVDDRWCLVHATHTTPDELTRLAATGAVVALCPTTEANLGDGMFPLESWLAAHGRFAIGSDSHVDLSPTEELRWLEYQARLQRRQRNVLVASGASTGALLWQQACAAGARACGRTIGAIEVGRRADIVVLDTNAALFVGRTEDTLMDTFVFGGPGSAVRDVMVGGRWLVQEGRHFAETAIAAGYRRAMQALARSE